MGIALSVTITALHSLLRLFLLLTGISPRLRALIGFYRLGAHFKSRSTDGDRNYPLGCGLRIIHLSLSVALKGGHEAYSTTSFYFFSIFVDGSLSSSGKKVWSSKLRVFRSSARKANWISARIMSPRILLCVSRSLLERSSSEVPLLIRQNLLNRSSPWSCIFVCLRLEALLAYIFPRVNWNFSRLPFLRSRSWRFLLVDNIFMPALRFK